MVQFSDQYRASPSPLRSMEMNRSPDASGPLSPTLTLNSALQTTEFRNEQPLSRSNTKSSIVEKLSDTARNHFVAMVGEFVGTVLFLFFAFAGTQVANSVNTSSGKTLAETGSNPQQLLYISLCFGFSLAVNAWTFFRVSGGLFNPAVTLGMCLIGAMPWVRGGLLVLTQILGGMTAAGLVSCMFPGPLNVGTTLGFGTSTAQGVFIEMFLTAQLVFTIFMLAAEKHRGTFIAPVGIGLSLFIAELTGVLWTGGSLNPARSFGPAVATRTFESTHWIYWIGPMLGACVAAGLYHLLKFLDYETANPGQDVESSEVEHELKQQHSTRRLKTSSISSPATETFWTGPNAAEAAAFATDGGCAKCRFAQYDRRGTWDSGSPTIREKPSISSRLAPQTTNPDSSSIYQRRLPNSELQRDNVLGLQNPEIHLVNPTPPALAEYQGRNNQLELSESGSTLGSDGRTQFARIVSN